MITPDYQYFPNISSNLQKKRPQMRSFRNYKASIPIARSFHGIHLIIL